MSLACDDLHLDALFMFIVSEKKGNKPQKKCFPAYKQQEAAKEGGGDLPT